MHIPGEPAERSRPSMSTDRITAAALQIVDTEAVLAVRLPVQVSGRSGRVRWTA
jgi:hypothetical protein